MSLTLKALLAFKLLILLSLCERIDCAVKSNFLEDDKLTIQFELGFINKNLTLHEIVAKCFENDIPDTITELYTLLVVDKSKQHLQQCILHRIPHSRNNNYETDIRKCSDFDVKTCGIIENEDDSCIINHNFCAKDATELSKDVEALVKCKAIKGQYGIQLVPEECLEVMLKLGYNERDYEICTRSGDSEDEIICPLSHIEVVLGAPYLYLFERHSGSLWLKKDMLKSVENLLQKELNEAGYSHYKIKEFYYGISQENIIFPTYKTSYITQYNAVLLNKKTVKLEACTIKRVYNVNMKPTINVIFVQNYDPKSMDNIDFPVVVNE